MKRLRPCALAALSMTLAWGPPAFAANPGNPAVVQSTEVPAGALAATRIGLYQWINDFLKDNVRPDEQFVLDVQNIEQLKSARIGRGFAMKVVNPDQLMAGGKLHEATHANGEWRFIVMVGAHAVGLANVRMGANGYQMVGLGGKKLAEDIEKTLAAHPGQSATLLRSYQARADFMELHAGSTTHARYAPLLAARASAIGTRDSKANTISNRSMGDTDLLEEDALAVELRDATTYDARTEGNSP